MNRVAQPGQVVWLGVRPARRAAVAVLDRADILAEGLVGDRNARSGKRAVTLIQAEHLPVIAALAGKTAVGFAPLRRNIGVARVNLLALKGRVVAVGSAQLRITGPCAPCSRMEAALGPGGYSAMRGHGGVTAEVLRPGVVALGDPVSPGWDILPARNTT